MVIDDALTAIERENERRKGFLPKNFARPELDKRRLGDVVDLWRGTDSPKPVLVSTCRRN